MVVGKQVNRSETAERRSEPGWRHFFFLFIIVFMLQNREVRSDGGAADQSARLISSSRPRPLYLISVVYSALCHYFCCRYVICGVVTPPTLLPPVADLLIVRILNLSTVSGVLPHSEMEQVTSSVPPQSAHSCSCCPRCYFSYYFQSIFIPHEYY